MTTARRAGTLATGLGRGLTGMTAPAATGLTAAVIGTGIMMMARIRNPIIDRNPYWLTDTSWGLTYVLHGLAGVGFVGLIIAHIYFALRPEKLWITKSMIFGYITRRQYLEHHDPDRWRTAAN